MKQTVVYVAGHSGGHIIPALTLAEQVRERYPEYKLVIFTTDAALDAQLVKKHAAWIEHVPLAMRAGNGIFRFVTRMWRLVRAWQKSLWLLYKLRPMKVVSMGGLVSLPVCLAAWCLRIEIEVYELNVEPGKAVKFLSHFASAIFICFPETRKLMRGSHLYQTDYPLRFKIQDRYTPHDARARLCLDQTKKTLLIMGGSQGSRTLNEQLRSFVEQCSLQARNSLQVIHQTGVEDVVRMNEFYEQQSVKALVFSYRQDIELCYSAADCVVTRAGAGALHELALFKKSAVIVPLETHSTVHQLANARAFVSRHPQLLHMIRQQAALAQPNHFFGLIERGLITSVPEDVPE